MGADYTGRFAPSPTGALHAGSLVAALASWLDARAHGGRWLVRMEDVDTTRCTEALGHHILQQLHALGLMPDGPVLWQTTRTPAYANALTELQRRGLAYPCACSRSDIDVALAAAGRVPPRHGERIYPGTCRQGLHGRAPRAWRFRLAYDPPAHTVAWNDLRLGPQHQDVAQAVGDFILQRADGLHAYQLAVVVDDAWQGITHVVRGEDLADNTARQILLQQALGLPTPSYLHVPLVLGADGQKLSKQNGAAALDTTRPLQALRQAAQVLGLPDVQATEVRAWLQAMVAAWAQKWMQEWAQESAQKWVASSAPSLTSQRNPP